MADTHLYPTEPRPVLARLFPIVRWPEDPNQPVADWITNFLDENLYFLQARGWEFANLYTNPATCPDDYLDWLADLIWADPDFWDSAWLPDEKRRLLINARYLRETRGSASTFRWLLQNFSLNASFDPIGGWIVGDAAVASHLPADLSGSPFDWRVTIDPTYLDSTPQYDLILKIIKSWLPCWVDVEIFRPALPAAPTTQANPAPMPEWNPLHS